MQMYEFLHKNTIYIVFANDNIEALNKLLKHISKEDNVKKDLEYELSMNKVIIDYDPNTYIGMC